MFDGRLWMRCVPASHLVRLGQINAHGARADAQQEYRGRRVVLELLERLGVKLESIGYGLA